MGDHDALFKGVFAIPENAAGMLRGVLSADLVAALDLSRLELLSGESITDNLDEQRADLLFRAPLRDLGDDGVEEYVYLPLRVDDGHVAAARQPSRGLAHDAPPRLSRSAPASRGGVA